MQQVLQDFEQLRARDSQVLRALIYNDSKMKRQELSIN